MSCVKAGADLVYGHPSVSSASPCPDLHPTFWILPWAGGKTAHSHGHLPPGTPGPDRHSLPRPREDRTHVLSSQLDRQPAGEEDEDLATAMAQGSRLAP